jgi:hypothetical protein
MNNPLFCYVFNNNSTKTFSHAPILLELTRQLAQTFSGGCCAFVSDFFPDIAIKDFAEVCQKFSQNSFQFVEKSKRKDHYDKVINKLMQENKASTYKNHWQPTDASHQIELFRNSRKNSDVYLKERKEFQAVLDDILCGPKEMIIPAFACLKIFTGANESYTASFTNVVDYYHYKVSFVIKETSQLQQTCEELFMFNYFDITPPYYMHFDFDENMPEIHRMCREKNILEEIVKEIATNKNPINMKFKFLNKKLFIEKTTANQNDNLTIDQIKTRFLNIEYKKAELAKKICDTVNCDFSSKIAICDALFHTPNYLIKDFLMLDKKKSGVVERFSHKLMTSDNLSELYTISSVHAQKEGILLSAFNDIMSYVITGNWNMQKLIDWQKIAVFLGAEKVLARISVFLSRMTFEKKI